MRLANICKGIEWSEDKIIFISKDDDHHLFSEYLNSVSPSNLESEKNLIEAFSKLIDKKTQSEIENIILKKYEGFLFIKECPYAKIAGANDLAPAILYDFKNQNLTIYHPNTKKSLPSNISFSELLSFLSDAISTSKNLII